MPSPIPVRVLFVEDSPDDVDLLVRRLTAAGFGLTWKRVDDAASFEHALDEGAWDLILCDYAMPLFGPEEALTMLQQRALDVPLIVVSGVIDEPTAVGLMKAGARDYILKNNPVRIVPAVTRELREAIARHEGRELHRVLRQSESFFRTVVQFSSDVIIVTDPDGTIMHVSPSLQRVLQRHPEEVIETDFVDLLSADERERVAWILRDATDDQPATFEARFIRPDGAVRVLESVARPFRTTTGGRAIAISARDITERKQQEENLRETSARLEQYEAQLQQVAKLEAIGRLAGGIAHDFNNLLAAIIGYGELALEQLDGHPARNDVTQMMDAGRRAATLTRQLLAFSRQQVLEPQIVDANGIVVDIAQLLTRLLGHEIVLVTDLDNELPPIRADRGQIEQVLMNLAVNARDAMPGGGELRIATRSLNLDRPEAAAVGAEAGRYVQLLVSDTGIGMNAATLKRAFEPFFTTKERGEGTGLGLATVYGIVRQSGGGVDVESRVGVGTTFRLYFPAADAAGAPPSTAVPAASA